MPPNLREDVGAEHCQPISIRNPVFHPRRQSHHPVAYPLYSRSQNLLSESLVELISSVGVKVGPSVLRPQGPRYLKGSLSAVVERKVLEQELVWTRSLIIPNRHHRPRSSAASWLSAGEAWVWKKSKRERRKSNRNRPAGSLASGEA